MTQQLTASAPFDDERPDDAESFIDGVTAYGGPVDAPAEPKTIYGTVTSATDVARKPIVPAWARSKTQRREVAAGAGNLAAYSVAFHLTRSPKYLGKLLVFAPVGVVRFVARQVRWAWVIEAHGLRQAAATANDTVAWERLHRHVRLVRKWRVPAVSVEFVALFVGALVALVMAPRWSVYVALVPLVLLAARFGRPIDKPITDRVLVGRAFTRLTAEMVRTALVALRIVAIKEPGDVAFDQPGVHRDSGGWLAPVLLPPGVEAITVIERRGALSSALRLPLDQVWPEVGSEHAGQLHLWVSQRPVSQMPAPRWSLLSGPAVSFFEPVPVGYDERGRPVRHTLFQRNTLIGGQPGSGKSFDGRAIVLAGLLDPTCELWLAAFKPSEDHYDLEPFTTRYLCGVDEGTLDAAAALVDDVLAEIQRRQKTLGRLKRAGKIAEGRTSPELARAGLGLHPLVVFLDEVHELFLHSKGAGEAMARALKQGRSCGVHVVLVTQVAGRDSVPPEITRVISSRWCLSVLDQVANDQVMGTGAYKRGQTGTQFRPGIDAGWGVTSGIQDGYNGAARGYYPTGRDLAMLLDRIKTIRADSAFGPFEVDETPARDIVRDVLHVFADQGARRLHREPLAQLLGATWPEYDGMSADTVASKLRDAGVPIEQVDVAGTNRRGVKIERLHEALAARSTEAELTD